jgi:hypothetical protein
MQNIQTNHPQARVLAGDVEGAKAAWRDAYQAASLITGGFF